MRQPRSQRVLEQLHRCSACRRDLPPAEFNQCAAKARGLDNYCRECRRDYRKRYHVENAIALAQKAERQRMRNGPGTYPWVLYILRSAPCRFCERKDVRRRFKLRVGPRRFSIMSAKQNGVSEETVRAALPNYDVVCGRCAPYGLPYAGAYSVARQD